MDFDLWVRFVGAGAKFKYVPVVLSGFRKYAAQKNQRLRKISDDEDYEILSDYLGRRPSMLERNGKRLFWRMTRILIKTLRLKYLPQRQFSRTQFQEQG